MVLQDVSNSIDYQESVRNDSFTFQQNEMVSSMGALKGNSEERTAVSLNFLDVRMEWSTPSSKEPSTKKLLNPGAEESTKKINQVLPTDPLNSSKEASGEDIHFKSKVDPLSENFSRGKRSVREMLFHHFFR